MREEQAFTALPFAVRIGPDSLELPTALDAGKIIPAGETIEAGVAAVIMTIDGGKSRWAPVHPASRPDFHRRDGFALILP
jgi:hypothetical protein